MSAARVTPEIIIVDDGSTDARVEGCLSEIERSFPCVTLRRQPNQGLSAARNAGLDIATGDYVQFLDADDLLVPNKLDVQVAHLAANAGLDISVSNYLLCDEDRSQVFKSEEAIAGFDLSLEDFLFRWERGFCIPIHCGLFRRRLFDRVRFDRNALGKEDWLLWTTLALQGARIGYVHGHYAIYRQHNASMSRSYVKMSKAWLAATLKIDRLLDGRFPHFINSGVSWFERFYRSHPSYQAELARLMEAPSACIDDAPAVSRSQRMSVDVSNLLDRLSTRDRDPVAPLITVVIPIYGHFEFLAECLGSLAEQGSASLEIVAIDDASPDSRVGELMAALEGRLTRLRIIRHQTNLGISATLNEAVDLAHGEFIAFLDCDDALPALALDRIAREIRSRPEVDYWFTDRLDVDDFGNVIRRSVYGGYGHIKPCGDDFIGAHLLDGMVASHLKVIRRSTYLEIGGTDEVFTGVQDWELALRVARTGRFGYIPEPLYRHRIHRESVTTSDAVRQFRLTNKVRRVFSASGPHADDRQKAAPDPVLELWRKGSPGICVFGGKDGAPALDELKASWSSRLLCVMDLRGPSRPATLNFTREFNSYFDLILWDDPAVFAGLAGYLWASITRRI